jgi:hypothetical protein
VFRVTIRGERGLRNTRDPKARVCVCERNDDREESTYVLYHSLIFLRHSFSAEDQFFL